MTNGEGLKITDLIDTASSKLTTQNYSSNESIDGVEIIELETHVGEQGDFSEVLVLNEAGEVEGIPGFKLAQINRTRLLPNSIKAWHLHLKQYEMWFVPPTSQLFVGLWDVRKDSSTSGKSLRINMGGGKSEILIIPKGVAHGSGNFSGKEAELIYFVNRSFNRENPDEHRLPWDTLGSDFWTPAKD